MAMEDKQAFGSLHSGLAAFDCQNLCNRYEPVTVTTMLELRNEWATVTLKDLGQSPDTFFIELEYLRSRLRGIVSPVILSDDELLI